MLTINPTKHLIGITIRGDYKDLRELEESVHGIIGLDDDPDGVYYGVKDRLRGICYDIHHASEGGGHVLLEKNGITEEIISSCSLTVPSENVYYSVEIFFPEALFIAAAIPEMCELAIEAYGSDTGEEGNGLPLSRYYRDKANLLVLCTAIWQALGEAIGEEDTEKILTLYSLSSGDYKNYVIQYIDKCNVELLNAPEEKRKEKLRGIAKKIVKKPYEYFKIENDVEYWARERKTSIYKLYDPKLEYPEIQEW